MKQHYLKFALTTIFATCNRLFTMFAFLTDHQMVYMVNNTIDTTGWHSMFYQFFMSICIITNIVGILYHGIAMICRQVEEYKQLNYFKCRKSLV